MLSLLCPRSTTFLRNSQTEDIVTNKVNSTAINSPQAASTYVSSYVTTQTVTSLESTSKTVSQNVSQRSYQTFGATSTSVVEIAPREYSESARNDPNLTRGVTHEIPSCSTPGENNHHSPSVVSYWSGQTTDVRFQNPLAITSQLEQQNAERLHFLSDTSSNARTDRYPQSSRVFQGLPAPNNTNMWQNSPPPQRFTDNSINPSQSSFQMPQGYYASSPVTPERTFQAPRRSLSSLSHSSSTLPPSSPASDIYPPSPTNTRVTSPHVTVETRRQQSPSPAEYHTNSYPQSPPRISHSPQIQNADGYISSSSPGSASQRRVMQGYSHYPTQSSQIRDRYVQAPVFTADPSSPYTPPHTPDRSSQSPSQYPPLSPSLAPVYNQAPARVHHIPSGTNELYPTMSSYSPKSPNDVRSLSGEYSLPLQSIANYPQSPYEYSKRSPQTPTNPRERYLQSNVPPHTMPQDSLGYSRSPERYSQRSPTLPPPVRRNEFNEQSVTRLSQPAPVVHNNTRFSVQPDQQHVTNVDHQAQYKKSAEDSLQPCQVKSDIAPRSPSTTSRMPREMLSRNFQSPLQFGSNLEVRAQSSEMIPLSRTNNSIAPDDLSKTSLNCESQTSVDVANRRCLGEQEEQTYQQTQGIDIIFFIIVNNSSPKWGCIVQGYSPRRRKYHIVRLS